MAIGTWETTTRSPAVLFLDAKNARLAQINDQASERELLEELVTKEDVYSIAKSIVENGYFPNEFLVAVRENSKTIIVEGNCRLAACKLLVNPDAAPGNFQSKFRSLSGKANLSSLKDIPICIAPSREATHAIVLKRHTKLPISKWEPPMQAKFYRQLVDSGMTVEEIARAAGQPESDVKASLRDHHLYEMACRLTLPSEIADKVRDPHSFPLSTLGRVFDVREAREFFGVEVDENGEIKGSISEDEFAKGFAHLVTDVATGKDRKGKPVTSRTLNKAGDVKEYLETMPNENKPNRKEKGGFTSSSFRLGTKATQSRTSTKPSKLKPRTKTIGLIPNTIPCNVQNQRVQNLFRELRKISPESYPNACALLLRAFLEMSVYCYLNSKGEIVAMANEFAAEVKAHNEKHPTKPKQVPAHWTPDFNAMINRLRDSKRNLIPSGHVTKALQKAVDEEEELFALNLHTHNTTFHPEGARLRVSWARFEELIKIILA